MAESIWLFTELLSRSVLPNFHLETVPAWKRTVFSSVRIVLFCLSYGYNNMGDGTVKTKSKGDRHGRPPFNLCFKSETLVGRSYILPGRPPGYVDFVARKFHVPDDFVCSPDCIEKAGKSHDEFPRQKYPKGGVQESHVYGWYHDVSFRPMETAVSRKFNFPRSMNELFRLSER